MQRIRIFGHFSLPKAKSNMIFLCHHERSDSCANKNRANQRQNEMNKKEIRNEKERKERRKNQLHYDIYVYTHSNS